MNDETEMTIIQGTVRPRDISPMNTVYSYYLADVEISHKGKGTVNNGQRPGLLVRLINWIL
jgi:flagellar L-ring protein precursor FlgH